MWGLDPTWLDGAFRRGGTHPKAATCPHYSTSTPLTPTSLHLHLHHSPFTLLHYHSLPHISTLLHVPLPFTYVHLLLDLRISHWSCHLFCYINKVDLSPLLVGVLGRRIPTLYHYFLFEDWIKTLEFKKVYCASVWMIIVMCSNLWGDVVVITCFSIVNIGLWRGVVTR